MSEGDHASHLGRHVAQIVKLHGPDKTQTLLEHAGMILDNMAVRSAAGPITAKDCRRYLDALQTVLGDMAHSFARVNFLLAGCTGVDRESL